MKAPKFQLVEVAINNPVTGQLQTFNFGQQPQLQSISGDKQVYIKSIEAYTSDMIAMSPITPQNQVVSAADIPNSVLILSVAGILEFNQLPLSRLVDIQGTISPSSFWPYLFRNLFQIDWTKSQVQIILPPATPTPFSYLFGVVYDYVPDEFDEEVGYESRH
jgi:hypothetical protein